MRYCKSHWTIIKVTFKSRGTGWKLIWTQHFFPSQGVWAFWTLAFSHSHLEGPLWGILYFREIPSKQESVAKPGTRESECLFILSRCPFEHNTAAPHSEHPSAVKSAGLWLGLEAVHRNPGKQLFLCWKQCSASWPSTNGQGFICQYLYTLVPSKTNTSHHS